jgi:thymidine phosphorylase
MLVQGKAVRTIAEGTARIDAAISSGDGLDRLRRCVQLQGGDPRCIDDPARLPTARHHEIWKAPRRGRLVRLDAGLIGRAATLLGAGRLRKEDRVDPGVGITFHAKQGDALERGQPIATVHYSQAARLESARPLLAQAITVADEKPRRSPPLVLERVS